MHFLCRVSALYRLQHTFRNVHTHREALKHNMIIEKDAIEYICNYNTLLLDAGPDLPDMNTGAWMSATRHLGDMGPITHISRNVCSASHEIRSIASSASVCCMSCIEPCMGQMSSRPNVDADTPRSRHRPACSHTALSERNMSWRKDIMMDLHIQQR